MHIGKGIKSGHYIAVVVKGGTQATVYDDEKVTIARNTSLSEYCHNKNTRSKQYPGKNHCTTIVYKKTS